MLNCISLWKYAISSHLSRLSVYSESGKMNHSNGDVTSSCGGSARKLLEEMKSRCAYTSIPNEMSILSTRHVDNPYLKAQSELEPRFNI